MIRDVHWWSVNDSDFAVIGGFNWWATTFFSLASFFGTWAIGLALELFMSEALAAQKIVVIGWLTRACVVFTSLFFVLGVVYVTKKKSHIQEIKTRSHAESAA